MIYKNFAFFFFSPPKNSPFIYLFCLYLSIDVKTLQITETTFEILQSKPKN